MTTCSTVQIDSKPNFSAFCASVARSSGLLNGPALANISPIFINGSPCRQILASRICTAPPRPLETVTRGEKVPVLRKFQSSIAIWRGVFAQLVTHRPASYLGMHGYRQSRHLVFPRRDDGGGKRGVCTQGRKTRLRRDVDSRGGRTRAVCAFGLPRRADRANCIRDRYREYLGARPDHDVGGVQDGRRRVGWPLLAWDRREPQAARRQSARP